MYDKIEELESKLIEAKVKKETIEAEKLTEVNDDDFLACNIVEGLFAGSEDSAGVGAVKFGDVALHFADSIGVDFHQRDVAAANSQTNSADASVEIKGWLARLANIFLFRPARR